MMMMTTREKQLALYKEHYVPRTDDGKTLTLEDLIRELRQADQLFIAEEKLADSWGVPVTFVRSLRSTTKEWTPK